MDFGKLFSDYGFNGVVIGTLFFILWRMLVWVMKWVDKQSEQHNAERTVWAKVLENLNQSILLHNQGSIEARRTTEEAHKFQRTEHEKMINNLDEQAKVLARINGYKA